MDPPARFVIPTCAGCGAMREFESCTGSCSQERKVELVSGGEYDTLIVASAARRDRIRAFMAVVDELALSNPGLGELRVAYEVLREAARSVLRRFGPAARSASDDSLASAETVVVWRCPECGGLDAPQPCIDVCIWRRVDWVEADGYESERARTVLERELERSLSGLLGRLAFATPRAGAWERNWRTLRSQAQLAVEIGDESPATVIGLAPR